MLLNFNLVSKVLLASKLVTGAIAITYCKIKWSCQDFLFIATVLSMYTLPYGYTDNIDICYKFVSSWLDGREYSQ